MANEPSHEVELSRPPRNQSNASEASTSRPHWTQAQSRAPGESVKVSLHDCLACSGCVTSAESVLLESQSGTELMERLNQAKVFRDFVTCAGRGSAISSLLHALLPTPLTVVVSLSPQSKASLAAFYGISTDEAFSRLSGWFKERGAAHVLDVEDGRDISLIESAAEFISRLRSRQQASSSKGGGVGDLPMLASSCPGWVVYAEKTQGDFVLPYLSTTRSPQGVMGSLVKQVLRSRLTHHLQVEGSIRAEEVTVYHATIMPCFDKKLEAVRDELTLMDDATRSTVPEVDCCLTTSEIHKILADSGITDIRSLPMDGDGKVSLQQLIHQGHSDNDSTSSAMEVDCSARNLAQIDARIMGSGGYFDFIFRSAAKEVFGVNLPSGPLPLQAMRNSDFQELTLGNGADGQRPLMKFAICYGFRNIQSLMRKIKSGKCDYDFVEVMACPSGCLNGGGQIKPLPGETASQVLERLEAVYDSSTRLGQGSEQDDLVRELYKVWIQGDPGSRQARSLLHTSFKKRDKQGIANAIDF